MWNNCMTNNDSHRGGVRNGNNTKDACNNESVVVAQRVVLAEGLSVETFFESAVSTVKYRRLCE